MKSLKEIFQKQPNEKQQIAKHLAEVRESEGPNSRRFHDEQSRMVDLSLQVTKVKQAKKALADSQKKPSTWFRRKVPTFDEGQKDIEANFKKILKQQEAAQGTVADVKRGLKDIREGDAKSLGLFRSRKKVSSEQNASEMSTEELAQKITDELQRRGQTDLPPGTSTSDAIKKALSEANKV